MTEQNTFKRYDSPEQYAEAFQQMIDARERWREQVREQEAQIARWRFLPIYSTNDSVTFKNVNYYAGILMRHDHPLHDMILSYYQDFLKHVPQLYAPRDK